MSPGYIVSLVLAGLSLAGTFVAAFVLFFIGLFSGIEDTDDYGRVQLPGDATLELPSGEVSVFYEERSNSASLPEGISYAVRPAAGGPPLATEGRGTFDERATEGGVTRIRYGRVEVPRSGRYLVAAKASGEVGTDAALTFGESLTSDAIDHVAKALWGLLGLALAALIALGTLLLRSLRHQDERVELPPER